MFMTGEKGKKSGMKIVFLDSIIINPGDISWAGIEAMGHFENYSHTAREEVCERLEGAEAVFVDSIEIDRETMECCPELKFIGVAATGYNHIDLKAAAERGIAVTNIPTYATDAVAQHTMALLLSITNQVALYNRAVASGEWQNCLAYTFVKAPLTLLAGKSIGIIGYGSIGRRVGEMAEIFGMKVNRYSRDKEAAIKSDVVSLHCPLTKENAGMVDTAFIEQMKEGAILINTARGGLIDEEALAAALKTGKLAGAGLDVLSKEPPEADNPLIGLPNCHITPHIAFIPVETRRKIIAACEANLKSFLEGGRLNRLV